MMTGSVIYTIALGLALTLAFICLAVGLGPSNDRRKEITERGNPVTGRVVKLKYRRHARWFFIKTGYSDVTVEFKCQGGIKRMEAASSVPNDTYKVGGDIDLLYLEEYPKTVEIKGTKPLTPKQLTLLRILFAALAVIMVVITVLGVREEMRREEREKRVREYMESLERRNKDQYEEALRSISEAFSE